MSDEARSLWPHMVDEIADRGFLERVPPHRLSIYCQLLAQYHKVTKAVNENGQVFETRDDKGVVKGEGIAPEAVQQEKLIKLLKMYDKDFGFLEERTGADDPYQAMLDRLSARMSAGTETD